MTYTIKVTQDDIRRGKPIDPCGCPIAIAIHRATGDANLRVGGEHLWTTTQDCFGWQVPLPPDALAWRRAFDRRERVSPFTFTIELPEVASA